MFTNFSNAVATAPLNAAADPVWFEFELDGTGGTAGGANALGAASASGGDLNRRFQQVLASGNQYEWIGAVGWIEKNGTAGIDSSRSVLAADYYSPLMNYCRGCEINSVSPKAWRRTVTRLFELLMSTGASAHINTQSECPHTVFVTPIQYACARPVVSQSIHQINCLLSHAACEPFRHDNGLLHTVFAVDAFCRADSYKPANPFADSTPKDDDPQQPFAFTEYLRLVGPSIAGELVARAIALPHDERYAVLNRNVDGRTPLLCALRNDQSGVVAQLTALMADGLVEVDVYSFEHQSWSRLDDDPNAAEPRAMGGTSERAVLRRGGKKPGIPPRVQAGLRDADTYRTRRNQTVASICGSMQSPLPPRVIAIIHAYGARAPTAGEWRLFGSSFLEETIDTGAGEVQHEFERLLANLSPVAWRAAVQLYHKHAAARVIDTSRSVMDRGAGVDACLALWLWCKHAGHVMTADQHAPFARDSAWESASEKMAVVTQLFDILMNTGSRPFLMASRRGTSDARVTPFAYAFQNRSVEQVRVLLQQPGVDVDPFVCVPGLLSVVLRQDEWCTSHRYALLSDGDGGRERSVACVLIDRAGRAGRYDLLNHICQSTDGANTDLSTPSPFGSAQRDTLATPLHTAIQFTRMAELTALCTFLPVLELDVFDFARGKWVHGTMKERELNSTLIGADLSMTTYRHERDERVRRILLGIDHPLVRRAGISGGGTAYLIPELVSIILSYGIAAPRPKPSASAPLPAAPAPAPASAFGMADAFGAFAVLAAAPPPSTIDGSGDGHGGGGGGGFFDLAHTLAAGPLSFPPGTDSAAAADFVFDFGAGTNAATGSGEAMFDATPPTTDAPNDPFNFSFPSATDFPEFSFADADAAPASASQPREAGVRDAVAMQSGVLSSAVVAPNDVSGGAAALAPPASSATAAATATTADAAPNDPFNFAFASANQFLEFSFVAPAP